LPQSDTEYDQPLVSVATVHKFGSARTASHVKSQPPGWAAQYASIDVEHSTWQPVVRLTVQAGSPPSLLQPSCASARITTSAKVRDRKLV
jgi:hypothetical protein